METKKSINVISFNVYYKSTPLSLSIAFIRADDPPQEPGRKVPPDPITHTNSDDILENIQGGNKDVYVIVFAVDQAKGDQLKTDIETALKEKHPWIRSTVVDFTKIQDYYKLFSVLTIEGEPKRGHTSPQVL